MKSCRSWATQIHQSQYVTLICLLVPCRMQQTAPRTSSTLRCRSRRRVGPGDTGRGKGNDAHLLPGVSRSPAVPCARMLRSRVPTPTGRRRLRCSFPGKNFLQCLVRIPAGSPRLSFVKGSRVVNSVCEPGSGRLVGSYINNHLTATIDPDCG
jgi:hypothetical protein